MSVWQGQYSTVDVGSLMGVGKLVGKEGLGGIVTYHKNGTQVATTYPNVKECEIQFNQLSTAFKEDNAGETVFTGEYIVVVVKHVIECGTGDKKTLYISYRSSKPLRDALVYDELESLRRDFQKLTKLMVGLSPGIKFA